MIFKCSMMIFHLKPAGTKITKNTLTIGMFFGYDFKILFGSYENNHLFKLISTQVTNNSYKYDYVHW